MWADLLIVPMPYGKILPDLTDCYYPSEGSIICPACSYDNVVAPSIKYNPELTVMEENRSPSGRWFCISCQDSWCYEREV